MSYTFIPATTNVVKNHEDWNFTVMFQKFGSKNVNDKPKYQRPDVDGNLLLFGEGNDWQKQLMADVIKGNPFQPIHLRYTNGIWEIVDGGHRTRTIYKFLNGFVRLPEDTILLDINGKEFDLSNKTIGDIIKEFPVLSNYIWNTLKFEVYEYRYITNKQAEDLFIKLNNLHDMSHADKRNAIDNIIADVCRERGAVDSITAISIFKETTTKGIDKTLTHVSIPITRRATDEMISFALYYLYKKGVFGNNFGGLESQPELNEMYRDEDLIKSLSEVDSKLLSDLDSLLKIIDGVIRCGKLSSNRSGNWGKGSIKKLIMLVCESAWNAGGFPKYKPNHTKLYNSLKEAYSQLSKSKVSHHPHQLYEVVNNVVKPLSKDKQPKSVKYHETHQFPSVFTGGARVDDLLYILYHFQTLDVFGFGLKTTKKDDNRIFNETQKDELSIEQEHTCKKCKKDLSICDYTADHILGHAYGGPTDVKNGQLLCLDCNEMKSSGMDIDDVKYLCEKYGYEDFAGLSKYVLKGSITLNESQIKEVKQIIIN